MNKEKNSEKVFTFRGNVFTHVIGIGFFVFSAMFFMFQFTKFVVWATWNILGIISDYDNPVFGNTEIILLVFSLLFILLGVLILNTLTNPKGYLTIDAKGVYVGVLFGHKFIKYEDIDRIQVVKLFKSGRKAARTWVYAKNQKPGEEAGKNLKGYYIDLEYVKVSVDELKYALDEFGHGDLLQEI